MNITETAPYGTPLRWAVVFDTRAKERWMNWIALGKYKHVRALGYVPAVQAWVFYDVHFGRTDIVLVHKDGLRQILDDLIGAGADVVWMAPGPQRRRWLAAPFLCTTAIAHLLGLPGALRVDALYRKCLRNGGIAVASGHPPATRT